MFLLRKVKMMVRHLLERINKKSKRKTYTLDTGLSVVFVRSYINGVLSTERKMRLNRGYFLVDRNRLFRGWFNAEEEPVLITETSQSWEENPKNTEQLTLIIHDSIKVVEESDRQIGDENYTLYGELSFKGEKAVERFPVRIELSDQEIFFEAVLKLNRNDQEDRIVWLMHFLVFGQFLEN